MVLFGEVAVGGVEGLFDGCFVDFEVFLEFLVGDTELVLLVVEESLQHVDVFVESLPLLIDIEGVRLGFHPVLFVHLLDLRIENIQIHFQLFYFLCVLFGFRDVS